MSVKSYKSKVVISGDIVEIYEYSNPILEGYDIKEFHNVGRDNTASEDDKLINREKVYSRAKRDVRRVINANIGEFSKFVTLTFAENITDIRIASYEFKKFKQRLEDYVSHKLQYLAVVEFQKRGAIHYHVLMFNLPYIKSNELKRIWGNGFIKINKISEVDNVGAYVCKYMTKTDDDRLLGEKMWFRSRGLEEPTEIKEKERVDNLAIALPSSALCFENVFTSEFNSVSYKQYNMKLLKREDVG